MSVLGAIADDFTGATDLCNTLVKQGMRTVQLIDIPKQIDVGDADAVVIALKSRSCPVSKAVEQSIAALRWLRNIGCQQYLFKYCSTFDSTEQGNIGPVTDALLDELAADFTIVCPAFPETGRTIYYGNLFVNGEPLAESPMRNHPLTPMTDSNLVRVMARQSADTPKLIAYPTVKQGHGAIASKIAELRAQGARYAVVDAITDHDLLEIGQAVKDLALITGGSGIALGLPANYRAANQLEQIANAGGLPAVGGPSAILSGSCSTATLAQIEAFQQHWPSFSINPLALEAHHAEIEAEALAWAADLINKGPVLIYASAPPNEVEEVQRQIGRERAGQLIERTLANIAQALPGLGVRRLIVAGGETAGAVVQALGIRGLQIGAQIDPGVPWTVNLSAEPNLALALKSGNFGGREFFNKALTSSP